MRSRSASTLAALISAVLAALVVVAFGLIGLAGPQAHAEEAAGPTDSTSDSPTDGPTDEPTDGPTDPVSTGEPSDSSTDVPSDSSTDDATSPTDPNTSGGSTTGPSPTSTAASSEFEVDDAMLRWGINNESNNSGAAPGTINLFSAGKIADPGKGGQLLANATKGAKWSNGKRAGWTAVDGNVRIEKAQPDGSYRKATWAGTRTNRDGDPLGNYAVNTSFSDHQIVLTGGTGTVDPDQGDATITWDGDFTVIYYSGYSFFYVSDPVLKVTDGVGRLTATLSGFASDIDNTSRWKEIKPRTGVEIATLSNVDLSSELGFTVTPAYLGVTGPAQDQVTSGEYAGSFPAPFVSFATRVGSGPYWYSSGGAVDKNKPPLPLSVSYSASKPQPTPTTTTSPTATASVTNTAPNPPRIVTITPPAAPAVTLPAETTTVAANTSGRAINAVPMPTVLAADITPVAAPVESNRTVWLLGVALLALAGVVAVIPALVARLNRP